LQEALAEKEKWKAIHKEQKRIEKRQIKQTYLIKRPLTNNGRL